MAKNISDLPHALAHSDELTRLLDVRSPAVFLDYDGTLTPIVNRPEDSSHLSLSATDGTLGSSPPENWSRFCSYSPRG